MKKIAAVAILTIYWSFASLAAEVQVRTLRLPEGGRQPQVVQREGVLHVVCFRGDPKQGDAVYIRSDDGGQNFSEAVRVNSQPGSATAAGTIRGPQLAVGVDERVHVAWNGSSIAAPRGPLNPKMLPENPHNGLPMLYSRSGDDGRFEPQRNLMQMTFGLDGGGSIAAADDGSVFVAWHAKAPGAAEGEAGRRVWVAKSSDNGKTFRRERAVFGEQTGACGCCGMKLFADSRGNLAALFRSARQIVHRDIYLLASSDGGETFDGKLLDPWKISACPMSSMSLVENANGMLAAWETAGQVLFARIDSGRAKFDDPIAAPGPAGHRKHPRLAVNRRGEVILVWSVVKGWGKTGGLYWQVFDARGRPADDTGHVDNLPAWSFGTPFTQADGSFGVIY